MDVKLRIMGGLILWQTAGVKPGHCSKGRLDRGNPACYGHPMRLMMTMSKTTKTTALAGDLLAWSGSITA